MKTRFSSENVDNNSPRILPEKTCPDQDSKEITRAPKETRRMKNILPTSGISTSDFRPQRLTEV